jgi:hypothetical protein
MHIITQYLISEGINSAIVYLQNSDGLQGSYIFPMPDDMKEIEFLLKVKETANFLIDKFIEEKRVEDLD